MNWAQIYSLQIGAALLMVLLSLWAATQWAASMLGYQPALGPHWFELLGIKIYAPWSLFEWWVAFDSQAPHVFARAGAVAALGGVASGVVALGGAARRASQRLNPTPTARPAGRILAISPKRTCWASAASCWASLVGFICAAMAPSTSSPLPRPAPA